MFIFAQIHANAQSMFSAYHMFMFFFPFVFVVTFEWKQGEFCNKTYVLCFIKESNLFLYTDNVHLLYTYIQ